MFVFMACSIAFILLPKLGYWGMRYKIASIDECQTGTCDFISCVLHYEWALLDPAIFLQQHVHGLIVSATFIDLFGICEEFILTLNLFRKMSFDDKRRLGTALTQLSPEDLSKALDIVAQDNPEFQATAQEVDLDIDTLVIII